MLTVSADPVVVDSQLAAGLLLCPCSGVLAPWGHAVARPVRVGGRRQWLRPRRGRCRACRATHVLLPSVMLARRACAAAVVGGVLAAVAAGEAVRAVARAADVPRGTVRGWVVRPRGRAELLRGHFTAWAAWLGAPVEALDPTGDPLGDAVAAAGMAKPALLSQLLQHRRAEDQPVPWEPVRWLTRPQNPTPGRYAWWRATSSTCSRSDDPAAAFILRSDINTVADNPTDLLIASMAWRFGPILALRTD